MCRLRVKPTDGYRTNISIYMRNFGLKTHKNHDTNLLEPLCQTTIEYLDLLPYY